MIAVVAVLSFALDIALSSPTPAVDADIELVASFVKVALIDRSKAVALLSHDATMGWYDYFGSTFDFKYYDKLVKSCGFDFSHAGSRLANAPGRHMTVVFVRLDCRNKKRAAMPSKAEFLIDGNRIADLHIYG